MHVFVMIVFGMCALHEVLAEEFSDFLLSEMIRMQYKIETLENTIATIPELQDDTRRDERPRTEGGSTYIRWGRTSCPEGGTLVYHGYAAGNHHTHSGGGSNRLCLPRDPMWKVQVAGYQYSGRLYGSEYQFSKYPFMKNLHDHDVPCAVCRIPRNTVLMIPGRYECYDNFTLEYSGYLMSSSYSHAHSSEYVCVDETPETINAGQANHNGALFYLVETVCGSLSCPPYSDGSEVTCAVCSYAPKHNVQP